MHLIVRSGAMIAASVLFVVLSAHVSASAGDAQEEANRKTVLAFYEKGLNQKDADAALAYVGDRYVQHNPNAPTVPMAFANSSDSSAKNFRTPTARSSTLS